MLDGEDLRPQMGPSWPASCLLLSLAVEKGAPVSKGAPASRSFTVLGPFP